MRTCCWLILATCMLAGLYARADTVKLKDGTVLEGEITVEDDSTLSILLEFAGGTITQTRNLSKADIATVTRWTPEEKAKRKVQQDYENLGKYQLNPNTSYSAEYYDQIIHNGFRKFLDDHPNSPYTSNIIERAAQWIAERDQVAAGRAKYHGRWMPAGDVDRERGGQFLEQGRAALARGNPDLAIQQLRPILQMKELPELVSQAKTLLTSAYQQALTPLNHQQETLTSEIPSAQQHMDQARQALAQADASLRQTASSGQSFARDSNGASYQAMGGNAQQLFQGQAAVNQAQSDLGSAQNHLVELQSQLASIKQQMTTLQSQATAMGIQITPGEPAAVITTAQAPATTPPVPSPAGNDPPTVVDGLVTWVKNDWPVLALAGLVAIYLLSRLTKG